MELFLLQAAETAADWSLLLQLLLETLITVFVPVVAAFGIQFFRAKIAEAKATVPAEQLAFAEQVIANFVKAAEQTGLKDAVMSEGKAKKAMVLQLAEVELAKHNIRLDMEALSALVESAVYDEITKARSPELAPPVEDAVG